MNIVKLVFAFILSIGQIIGPYIQIAVNGGVDSFFEPWSETDEFKADYAFEIKKDPNKDFVILNFADIQLSPDRVFSEDGEYSNRLIKKCVEEVKPDLITLTGDNSSSDVGYLELIKLLDSFEIPWAVVMGNHDGNNGDKTKEGWDSYILSHAKNCLFKFGPSEMGYGNYIINITENGKIVHSLIMMDTHSDADDTEYGKINYGKNEDGTDSIGYDHVWTKQIKWYKWAVNGINKLAGNNVESSLFFHIPLYEYNEARDLYCNEVKDKDGNTEYVLKDEYKDLYFGSLKEGICSPNGNNGFFNEILRLNSTKNVIVGHDHVNSLCVEYKGVWLNYGLKSGHGSYWNADVMGASLLTIGSDGHGVFSHHYYSE